MKDIPYLTFDKIVLRTPYFPINYFLDLTSEEIVSLETLKREWSKIIVRESIYISSKSLYNSLILWEKGKIKDKQKRQRLEKALLKYLIRMSTRCTPFGLLAGYSSLKFGDSTKIVFQDKKHFKKQLTLDFKYLTKISKELIVSLLESQYVTWFPNSTIYDDNKFIRYIESNLIEGVIRLTTESIIKNDFLLKVLEIATKGKTYKELKKLLIANGISEIESGDFLNQLIENQVLVSNLEPNLTGTHYSEILQDVPEASSKFEDLKKIEFDKLYDIKLPLKVDLQKTMQNSILDKKWKQSIYKSIEFFNKITTRKKVDRLESFKKEFSKRYGTMEVSLGKVLDVEYGINYLNSRNSFGNNSFTNEFGSKFQIRDNESQMKWTQITSILNERVLKAKKLNQKEIRFYEKDFNHLTPDWDDLPTTMFAMLEFVIIDEREMLYMNSIGGKTATSIISRFSNDESEINSLVKEIVKHEELRNKDKILAEIVHVPSVKIANVLCRPNFREYEIPYLAKSNVHIDKQIPISDLTVSVIDNNIVLKSSKLDKEVIPMLSCAHDYSNSSLVVYQFLCDVGQANKTSRISFDWGSLISVYRYLPRVVYENVIVSKARWIVDNKNLFYKIKDKDVFFKSLKDWQNEHDVPSIVNLIDGDYKLIINFNNINSVEIFLDEIKDKKWFSVEEVLSNENTLVKDEKSNFYANEFIVSVGQK